MPADLLQIYNICSAFHLHFAAVQNFTNPTTLKNSANNLFFIALIKSL